MLAPSALRARLLCTAPALPQEDKVSPGAGGQSSPRARDRELRRVPLEVPAPPGRALCRCSSRCTGQHPPWCRGEHQGWG